jgi:ABC-2 type transport system permease protein
VSTDASTTAGAPGVAPRANTAGVAPSSGAAGQPSPDSAGVIHDIGYRQYDGQRLGRGHMFMALTWQGLRASFGIGRGARAKIVPLILFVLMCLPAAVSAVALATNPAGGALISYDNYIPSLRSLAMLVFVAVQAPTLVSADLRYHTLPLYFARPIRRTDYPAAKLTAFILACLVMIEVPLIILFIGNAAQAHGAHGVWAQATQLGPGLLYGLAWAVLLASISLLLASTTGRRVFATCAVGLPLFFSYILAHVLGQIGLNSFGPVAVSQFGQPIHPPALASLAGLISPFTLLGGVLHWLQKAPSPGAPVHINQITTIGSYGPVYMVVFIVAVVAFSGGLLLRYQRVGVA